jgi:hypothetical protein
MAHRDGNYGASSTCVYSEELGETGRSVQSCSYLLGAKLVEIPAIVIHFLWKGERERTPDLNSPRLYQTDPKRASARALTTDPKRARADKAAANWARVRVLSH